ncbi:MAG: hypothetical protein RLZZ326_3388 [Planctomycetota bacterium]
MRRSENESKATDFQDDALTFIISRCTRHKRIMRKPKACRTAIMDLDEI